MYIQNERQKLMYQLFPHRHMTRMFRGERVSYGEDVFINQPFHQMSSASVPSINPVYEEQSANGMEYQTMPNPYDLPLQSFEPIHDVQGQRFLGFPGIEAEPAFLQEGIPQSVEADNLEIADAVNEVSEPIHVMEHEVEQLATPVAEQQPTPEEAIQPTVNGMPLDSTPAQPANEALAPGMDAPGAGMEPAPEMQPGPDGQLQDPMELQNPMDLEQRLQDPFMNPLFNPLFGFGPFGPMGPMGPGGLGPGPGM